MKDKRGGARLGAGRKKGIGVSNSIRKHCEEFIINLLKDDAIRNKAIKDVQQSLFKEETGYLYIISNGRNLYKVGYSTNFKRRLKSYETHTPDFKIVYLLNSLASFELETLIHKTYKHRRHTGEWFSFTSDELLEIISTCSMLSI